VITELLQKLKELLWIDKLTQENGNKDQELEESKLLLNKVNYKKLENQMLILLKIGSNIIIPKKITILSHDFILLYIVYI
jgi:hypothetical protein